MYQPFNTGLWVNMFVSRRHPHFFIAVMSIDKLLNKEKFHVFSSPLSSDKSTRSTNCKNSEISVERGNREL